MTKPHPFDTRRYVTEIKSRDRVHDFNYSAALDLYKKSGLFIFAADAYLICREKRYEIPEELLTIVEKHFDQFVNAESKKQGLSALGFDNNKKGGAWQRKAALAQIKQEEILNMISALEAFGVKTKKEIFRLVATACGTTVPRVKTLHYAHCKRKK